MAPMRFEKWQALGNDYLIVERDELPFDLTPARVRRLCEGHMGIYADGVLLLSAPSDPAHVADLRIFNPDGSEAELSGNGAREAILYLRRRGWTQEDTFAIQTFAGEIRPTITGRETCTVDMGQASLTSADFPEGPQDGRGTVFSAGRDWSFQHVSIGNPQCAIHVDTLDQLEALDLPRIGPAIEADEQFPNRTNVSWFTELDPIHGNPPIPPTSPTRIRARIFERGVGETLSSGTGATGAAVAHTREYEPAVRPTAVTVLLDGGELEVEVAADLHINLTGWARPVFEGRISEEFEKELHETE
jgi:diaminopimelate epimerase